MRKSEQRHYFKKDEIELIGRIVKDIGVVLKCNKENEIPHRRAMEWRFWLSCLYNKHRKVNILTPEQKLQRFLDNLSSSIDEETKEKLRKAYKRVNKQKRSHKS